MKTIGVILVYVLLAGCSAPAAAPVIQQVTVISPATVEVTRLVPVTQLVEVTRVVAPTAAPATATVPATAGPTAAPTNAGPAGVATPQQVGQVIFTVITFKAIKSIDQFTTAKEGNVFIICDVLIQNIGPSKIDYNLFYFKVKDADGFEYTITSPPSPALGSGSLAGGDKVRGNVAFEIPQAGKSIVLAYDPTLVGTTGVIHVALGDVPAVK